MIYLINGATSASTGFKITILERAHKAVNFLMIIDFDYIIIGGGSVGAVLAALLEIHASPSGDISHEKSPEVMSETAPFWEIGPVPVGSHKASWV